MMLVTTMLARLSMMLVLAGLDSVVGFGYLSFPPATYHDPKISQIYTANMNTSIHPTFFTMRPIHTAKASHRADSRSTEFIDRLAFADYTSLRDFADEYYPGCGNSNIEDDVAPANVYNASFLMWRNEDEQFGFYRENDGPCETWIDNERVHFNSRCAMMYPDYPARIPMSFNSCAQGRTCELRFYWFAVQSSPFKLMKHCVKIINDPNAPVAKENTDPYKTVVNDKNSTCPRLQPSVRNDSFSVNLTITWERLWLTETEDLSHGNPNSRETTILIVP